MCFPVSATNCISDVKKSARPVRCAWTGTEHDSIPERHLHGQDRDAVPQSRRPVQGGDVTPLSPVGHNLPKLVGRHSFAVREVITRDKLPPAQRSNRTLSRLAVPLPATDVGNSVCRALALRWSTLPDIWAWEYSRVGPGRFVISPHELMVRPDAHLEK